jgi:Flp pilus assembly protein protease CpaA
MEGDWKLVGALGAFLGPPRLIAVLLATVLVAVVMAVVLIVWKRRVWPNFTQSRSHAGRAVFRFICPDRSFHWIIRTL